MGKLLFEITGTFAEFKPTMIKTPVCAGIQTVKETLARDGRFVNRKTGIVRRGLGPAWCREEKAWSCPADLTKGNDVIKTAKQIGLRDGPQAAHGACGNALNELPELRHSRGR